MSQSVIHALMRLFAIVANVDGLNDKSRSTVTLFLQDEVGSHAINEYLKIYDDFIQEHHFGTGSKDGQVKRTSKNSVKILRIAAEINKTLTRQQKLIVLIRLIEYIYAQNILTDQNLEFLETIVDGFNIDKEEFESLIEFVGIQETVGVKSEHIIFYGDQNQDELHQLEHPGLSATLVFINLVASKVIAFRILGSQELYLGNTPVKANKVHLFRQGSSVRSPKMTPLYHSNVLSRYTNETLESPVVFDVSELEYNFSDDRIGLHAMSFQAESGQLVGIMGGSGTGKSTLLNVLNGNSAPTHGQVTINNLSVHASDESSDGLIGYVPQDDLLMEDLTVYQNLFYNAQLIFGGFDNEQISEKVDAMLDALGLIETKNLKVGNALSKTISGGQRKRLNIALELIREPSILFVDEPTSGLSSRDSENIMDLLKELTSRGKLIFVVIHQPSSDIFKMFDKLLIMDKGGRLIYQGDPLEGVSYFKDASGHIDAEIGDCITCGNVNPEQIFDVIEAKVVDEFGDLTQQRKKEPEGWDALYQEKVVPKLEKKISPSKVPQVDFNIPSVLRQMKVFVTRDVLSKLANKQYMVVNLLEAPALAFIIAMFLRYQSSAVHHEGYVFRENTNMIAYLFISVVVALFLGLSVSAEEIIKDRKIRTRESFLNLSRGGYLSSKILIQFSVSAIQILLYVLIGNNIMGIHDMTFSYWLVLFSAACFANVLGLNISASFNDVVTIYILIPFIIIPQILFSGVLVKYNELNPWFSSERGVPIVGNVMASRWAYEALAVEQVTNNKLEQHYFDVNQGLFHFNWLKVYWVPEIQASISALTNDLRNQTITENSEYELRLIKNELSELPKNEIENLELKYLDLDIATLTQDELDELNDFVKVLIDYYGRRVSKYTAEKDEITLNLRRQLGGDQGLMDFKDEYENESLWEFVNNKKSIKKIKEIDGEFYRNENRLYQDPNEGINHYYSSKKLFAGKLYSTFNFNIVVLWLGTFLFIVALFFDLFPRAIELASGAFKNDFEK